MVKDGVRSNGLLENVHSTGRVVLSILTKSRLVDDVYPESDPHPGISYGSRVGAFDFFYAGIMVILGIESGVIENGCSYAGNVPWASTACNADFDRERFREIQIWKLGLIPVLNIRHYDLHGDEYNNSPYLYCTFDIDGMPYESFEYRIVGRDEYDWPLNPELQLREEGRQATAISKSDLNRVSRSSMTRRQGATSNRHRRIAERTRSDDADRASRFSSASSGCRSTVRQ